MTKFRIDPEKSLLIVETKVNGEGPFNFLVDTGASHSVLSNQTAEKLGLSGGAACRGAQGASPGSVAASMVNVSSIAVGGVEARDIEVALIDLTHLSKAWDGIIGNNFMKDYKVTIDYPKQEISFEKASGHIV